MPRRTFTNPAGKADALRIQALSRAYDKQAEVLKDVFEAGRKAKAAGKPISDCPRVADLEVSRTWRDGYLS